MIIPSIIGAMFILEAMARAEALSLNSISRTINRKGYNSITTQDSEMATFTPIQSSNWLVGNRKYEMSELCEIFLGINGLRLFSLTVSVYLYGSLWAYATVFANSLTANYPLGEFSYYFYLFVFALIVIPTSCYELSEQITLQMIYSACRVVMVVLMLSTVIIAYFKTGTTYVDNSLNLSENTTSIYDNSNTNFDNNHNNSTFTIEGLGNDINNDNSNNHLNLWNSGGLHIILPISLFAYIFHHSIPSLSEPVVEKKQLNQIFILTLVCCCFAYTVIGVVLSLYFGDAIKSSLNLNWMDYDGEKTFKDWSRTFRTIMVHIISSFVIVFPAVDVASAFPLCAITLGNNLLSTYSQANPFSSAANHQNLIK